MLPKSQKFYFTALLSLCLAIPCFAQNQKAKDDNCYSKVNTEVGELCSPILTGYKELVEKYTVNDSFKFNDVRRYGLFPNQKIEKHPSSSKSKFEIILDLAEAGVNMYFPTGFYDSPLLINSRSNINFYFDDVEFAGLIHITNDNGCSSKNIKLKGKIATYDRFGCYNTENIEIDTLICKSNAFKSYFKNEGRGCHIYKGTRNIEIKYLEIVP